MARTRIDCKIPVLRAGAHYLNSGFGKRTLDGKKSVHNGVDLVGGTDDAAATDYVIAFESGIVTSVRDDISGKTPSQGNSVVINHGGGFYSYYYHLKKGSAVVRAGAPVTRGDTLAYMGNTGNSTGAHLHFAMKKNGAWIDPLPYLLGDETLGTKRTFVDVRTCRSGDRGADVLIIQILLNKLIGAGLEEDGSYGPATVSAVGKFQSAEGIDSDGICGNKTWARLLRTSKT